MHMPHEVQQAMMIQLIEHGCPAGIAPLLEALTAKAMGFDVILGEVSEEVEELASSTDPSVEQIEALDEQDLQAMFRAIDEFRGGESDST